MIKVTAAEVNKLRKATGAGMMDCKKALVEAEGDFNKAIDILRKKGQKVAAKRADRDSSEGAAVAKVNAENTMGVAIVLGCETDVVGKNDGRNIRRHSYRRRRARWICNGHPCGAAWDENCGGRKPAPGGHLPQLGVHSNQSLAADRRSLPKHPTCRRIWYIYQWFII